VKLDVYTVSGRLVRRLVNGHEGRGGKTFVWDGYDDRGVEVASGIYFVTLRADGKMMTRKVEILR
jgi:flagellar hook assembly protein FlgD